MGPRATVAAIAVAALWVAAVAAPRLAPAPDRPAAAPRQAPVPAPPPARWRYIVLHHSATDAGSAQAFDRYHRARGWGGVAYHFVIGNGRGAPDGHVQPTFRWKRQLDGAHAGVRRYDHRGIGICLVGNFETDHPTPAQMRSLAALVRKLAADARIPPDRILRHSDVHNTVCPGRNFPYNALLDQVSNRTPREEDGA